MTRYYNGYLENQEGLFIRDWQHAARLYVDDVYRLAPKTKFLYYAVFNFNENAIQNTSFQQQNRQELNFLVKKMDLPKYTLNIENLNQYNRKTTTYTRITYDPVTLTFHDDNNGVSNAMWAMYYSYYFNDRLNTQTPYTDINPQAYVNHAYDPKISWPYRYGLDKGFREDYPFFNSIQLMTLSKHKFTSYLLCHPRITSWAHDTMDQSDGSGVVENTMTLAYDAVIYTTGTISIDNPSGFGTLHYDTYGSPLAPENQAFLAGALNDVFGNDLMANNPFNPVDLGISLLAATRQNAIIGNQAPYGGYGAGVIDTLTPAGGLQNYSVGSNVTLANLLSNQTLEPINNAPINPNANTGAAARTSAIQDQFAASLKGANPIDPPIITDVYANELPRDTPSSIESKIFSQFNTGVTVPETQNAVGIDYFDQADVRVAPAITTSELITNNPLNPDVPDNPFA